MTDFRVVSASDIADEIVNRLAPSEIPAEIGTFVAKVAEHGYLQGVACLGWDLHSLQLNYRLMPDGRIILQLVDCNARPFWKSPRSWAIRNG